MNHSDIPSGYAGLVGILGCTDDGRHEAASADHETALLQRLLDDEKLTPAETAAARGDLGTIAAVLSARKTLFDLGDNLIAAIAETASDTPETEMARALETGISETRAEIGSADEKTSTLVTVSTGALAGLVAFAHAHVPLPAAIALWAAAACTAAALAVLLWGVLRPRLGAAARTGTFGTTVQLLDALDTESPADLCRWQRFRLELFDRVAVAKHVRVRLAVYLLAAALVLLIVGAVLVATGGLA